MTESKILMRSSVATFMYSFSSETHFSVLLTWQILVVIAFFEDANASLNIPKLPNRLTEHLIVQARQTCRLALGA
jgi:hypothetical protein